MKALAFLTTAMFLLVQHNSAGTETKATLPPRLQSIVNRLASLPRAESNVNNTCPSGYSSLQNADRVGNVVMFSITGRVGSSNLLAMLTAAPVLAIGEIFKRTTLGLPPNINSPEQKPATHASKERLIDLIKTAFGFTATRRHKLISVKFWHAWVNGVTVSWLAKQLVIHGCVTHFIMISRNPVRITTSEQYAHKHSTWRHDSKKRLESTCEKANQAFRIGGRWACEMAKVQYKGFQEVIKVSKEVGNVKALGISYEKDVLPGPNIAYNKIVEFLLHTPTAAEERKASQSMHHKGLLCPLSLMLTNYEELQCSLEKFDSAHASSAVQFKVVNPLAWMAADEDMLTKSFEDMMRSWEFLWGSLKWKSLVECNKAEMRKRRNIHLEAGSINNNSTTTTSPLEAEEHPVAV